jgi:threonine/homoserine/homoserine lactone efflux protein
VLVGFGLGLVLAAQVGPVTLLIVRTVLRGRRALAVGLAMALAVAGVDVLYAALGLAGAGQLLSADRLRVPLGLASAAILVWIGLRTIHRGLWARLGLEDEAEVASPPGAFGVAVAASALNPLTIALWTVSFPAAADKALEPLEHVVPLLVGVAAGTATWYCAFALAVALARRRIGPRLLPAIDVGAGAGLVAFGGLVGYRTVTDD